MPRIYMAIAQADRYPITEIMQQTAGHSRQLPVGDLPDKSRRADLGNGDQQGTRLHVHDVRDSESAGAHQSRHTARGTAPLMEKRPGPHQQS